MFHISLEYDLSILTLNKIMVLSWFTTCSVRLECLVALESLKALHSSSLCRYVTATSCKLWSWSSLCWDICCYPTSACSRDLPFSLGWRYRVFDHCLLPESRQSLRFGSFTHSRIVCVERNVSGIAFCCCSVTIYISTKI